MFQESEAQTLGEQEYKQISMLNNLTPPYKAIKHLENVYRHCAELMKLANDIKRTLDKPNLFEMAFGAATTCMELIDINLNHCLDYAADAQNVPLY
jgi:hypothetical protein